jgi:uncharacterized protein
VSPTPPATFTVTDGLPPDWPSLTAGGPAVVRERWIRFGQSWYPGPYRTFALRTADGRCMVAAGGTVLGEPGPVARRDPWYILTGRLAHAGFVADDPAPWDGVEPEAVHPCLMLMYPNYNAFPVGPGAGDPASLDRFLGELVAWAAGAGVRSIVLLYMTERTGALLPALERAGFSKVRITDRSDLHVTWSDLDGYVDALPHGRRTAVRREIRAIAERGLKLDSRLMAADEPELLDLRCELVAKYDGSADPAVEARIFDHIREHVPPGDTTVFTVSRDGATLSFSLFIQDGDEWTAMLTGSRYSVPDASFGYFSTIFYQPAAEAPARGIRTISYGPAAGDAKRRRGCHLAPCYAAHLRLPT